MRGRFPRMPPAGRARPYSRRSCWGHPSSGPREGIVPLPVAALADHLPEDISGEERDIRRTFSEPAHQIWIPLRSERNVHAHAISFAHELVLEIAPHSIKHLELEAAGRDLILLRKSLRLLDNGFVVRRDARIVSVAHEGVHASIVFCVHLLLY